VQRQASVFEPFVADVPADQLAQMPLIDQAGSAAQEAEQACGTRREDLPAPYRYPQDFKIVEVDTSWITCDPGCVDRPDARTNDEIRTDSSGLERLQHADLHGTEGYSS